MTDYWKSYAKKFCEICKCWYADNKISTDRHETGLKHKAMVQQRLRESAKKAKDVEIANHEVKMTLYSMEQAARASMSNDQQRKVPTIPNESIEYDDNLNPNESDDPKAELREQKRKLKELKRTAKQSQYWMEDQVDDEIVPEKFSKIYEDLEEQPSMNNKYEVGYDSVTAQQPSNSVSVIPTYKHFTNEPKVVYQEFTYKPRDDKKLSLHNSNALEEDGRELPVEVNLNPLKEKEFPNESNSTLTSKHPYGPWIPVQKNSNQQNTNEGGKHVKEKHYDDLPKQEYGPGSKTLAQAPAELLEVAEIDPEELAFKQKELPTEKKKKTSKIVAFRHPAKCSSKSLRNKTST